MIWIDTHFHGGEYLPDFAAYIREAEEAGVRRLLLCASGKEETGPACDAAKRFPGLYYAVGLHPHNAESDRDFLPEDWRNIRERTRNTS